MERGEEGFEKKARELSVEGEQREEILGEIKKTAGEIYETRDGQDYIKALAEKRQGHQDAYHKMLDDMLLRMTKEYHRSTGY